MKLLHVLFTYLLFVSTAYAQSEKADNSDFYFVYDVVFFKTCEGGYTIQAHAEKFDFGTPKEQNLTVRAMILQQPRLGFTTIDQDGDAIFSNINLEEEEVSLKFQVLNEQGRILKEDVISRALDQTNGLATTTRKVDKSLEDFTRSGGYSSIIDLFCQGNFTYVEVFSFIKEYFDLTDGQICNITQNYVSIFGSFDSKAFISNPDFCSWLELFLIRTIGNTESSCKCKIVQTTGAAINYTAKKDHCGNPLDLDGNGIENKPYPRAFNQLDDGDDYGDEDNELQYTELINGASKAAAHLNYFDGGNVSPTPFFVDTKPAISELSYFLFCLDPTTLALSPNECNACTKTVYFKYGYYSDIEVRSRRAPNNIFNKHDAYINVQDFAMVITQNGDDIDIHENGWGKISACLTTEEDDLLNQAAIENSTEGFKKVIQFASEIATLELDVVSIVASVITEVIQNLLQQSCSDYSLSNSTLLSEETTYQILPGKRFKAIMISGSSFTSFTKTKGEAYGSVNSTCFLSSTLLSNAGNWDEEYCQCEKAGSYTIGSCEEHQAMIPHDRDSENSFYIDWANFHSDPSINKSTIENMIGIFMGQTGGDWQQLFPQNCPGCPIDISCDADFGYFKEDCESLEPEKQLHSEFSIHQDTVGFKVTTINKDHCKDCPSESLNVNIINDNSSREKYSYNVYPNPTDEYVFIDGDYLDHSLIYLYDAQGRLLQKFEQRIKERPLRIDLGKYERGVFILLIVDPEGERQTKRIIKI